MRWGLTVRVRSTGEVSAKKKVLFGISARGGESAVFLFFFIIDDDDADADGAGCFASDGVLFFFAMRGDEEEVEDVVDGGTRTIRF